MNGQQSSLVPNSIDPSTAFLNKDALTVRLTILEYALICVLKPAFRVILIHLQDPSSTTFSLVKLALVMLSGTLLDPSPMLVVLTVIALVSISKTRISIGSFAVKAVLFESTLVSSSISPLKFALTVFFSLKVVPFIPSLIILFDSPSMRSFVDPSALVVQIGSLMFIDSLIGTSALEMTAIMIDEEAVVKIRLKGVSYFALVVTPEITILFDFIQLYIALRQLVLKLIFLISVHQVIRMLHFPYLLGFSHKFRHFFDYLFGAMIGDGQGCHLCPQRRVSAYSLLVIEGFRGCPIWLRYVDRAVGFMYVSLVTTGITHNESKYINNQTYNMQEDPELHFQPLSTHPKWQPQILPLLQKLRQRAIPKEELINTMLSFHGRYCQHRPIPKLRSKPKPIHLKALQGLYLNRLGQLLQSLGTFLLKYNPGPIKLVLSQQRQRLQYPKKDLFYLLTLMFIGLVPKQLYDNNKRYEGRFHNMNTFSYVLSYNSFKTKCIVQYLQDTLRTIDQDQEQTFQIIRNCSNNNLHELISNAKSPLTEIHFKDNNTSIEQFIGQIKVDFANRFIGGGCLRDGCVQEQIIFAIRPLLYTTTLLCEKMDENEAIGLVGFRQHFNYKGYKNTTEYNGKTNIKYQIIQNNDSKIYDEKIIAIDAIKFKSLDPIQFEQKLIDRQILKAYTGFSALQGNAKIVTGGWGCGVYNGDFMTKILIQWIAASLAKKDVLFCPFGRLQYLEKAEYLKAMKHLTVQQAYDALIKAGKLRRDDQKANIYEILVGQLNKK